MLWHRVGRTLRGVDRDLSAQAPSDHFDLRLTVVQRQPIEPLTAREEEVLVPVAHGRTNNEIASELYITPSTVKAHLASLMRKLGARNRVEVAMWAHETGRI